MNRRSCIDYRQLIVRYADGDLGQEETQEVEAHLERCPECSKVLRTWTESLERIRAGMGQVPQGPGLALSAVSERVARLRRRRKTAYAAVGVSLLLAVLSLAAVTRSMLRSRETAVDKRQLWHTAESADEQVRLARHAGADDDLSVSEDSFMKQIEDEEVAAICLAAGLNLETAYGETALALVRYRYTIEQFPHTAPARKARERVDALTSGSI